MKKNSIKAQILKEQYISGMDVNEICKINNITRQTFYYYKWQAGDEWEKQKLNASRDLSNIKEREALFLNTLITSFENFIKENEKNALNPEVLENLDRYARTYWKLKAPKNDDFSLQDKLQKCAEATIKAIADLAVEQKNELLAKFLQENAETIIKRVFKAKMG